MCKTLRLAANVSPDFETGTGSRGRRFVVRVRTLTKTAVKTWRDQKVKDLVSGYSPDDVYNTVVTGVFYQTLPNKTVAIKNYHCKGRKQS